MDKQERMKAKYPVYELEVKPNTEEVDKLCRFNLVEEIVSTM